MIADFARSQTQPIPQNTSRATAKLLAFLAVCLATPGLLATTQTVAFSRDANSEMKAETSLHLTCIKQAEHFICQPQKTVQTGENLGQHQSTTDVTRVTATVVPQFLSPAQQKLISNILIGLTYLLPIGFGLGILMCDRYTRYRSAFLKQQVEVLERIWQQSHQH